MLTVPTFYPVPRSGAHRAGGARPRGRGLETCRFAVWGILSSWGHTHVASPWTSRFTHHSAYRATTQACSMSLEGRSGTYQSREVRAMDLFSWILRGAWRLPELLLQHLTPLETLAALALCLMMML